MIAQLTIPPMTPQEYFEWEEKQPIKYEYINGKVYAMTGGCKIFMADAKVGVSDNGPFHYPDVMVTCDSRDRTARQVVYHPCLIVEVLSPSTAYFDQGKKFRNYRRMDTLKEYILIESETMNVDCYRLNEKGKWELTTYSLEEPTINQTDLQVHFTTVDFHFPISSIYEDVVFPKDNPENS
ncbi:MAG: Uma2 family endonuclease [Microcoleaceae cyanobacterium MO_207.B10]|nr:Uma2 family endonuclease [Microcoleaceae cyanobacterium MO_207.B10]